MPGRPKKGTSHRLPNPATKPWFPVLGKPFIFHYLDENVFNGKCYKKPDRYQVASEYLRKSDSRRAKYVMCLLHMGRCIERSIDKLERERVLDVDEVERFAEVRSHAGFSVTDVKRVKSNIKDIDDEKFLIWLQALQDLKLALQAHYVDFMATYALTVVPEYDVPKKG